MILDYDKDTDVMFFRIKQTKNIIDTNEEASGILVSYDRETNEVVEIRILDFTKKKRKSSFVATNLVSND